MSDEIVLKKIKIKEKSVEFSYEKVSDENDVSEVNETHKAPVHPDFRLAMDALKIHAVVIFGIIKPKQVPNPATPKPELIENVNIYGISLSGDEDDRKLVITASYKGPHGPSGFNTHVLRMDSEGENAYSLIEHLDEIVARILDEGMKYLSGEKRGEDPQQQLPFGEGAEKVNEEETEEASA